MKLLTLSVLLLMQISLSHASKDHGGGDTFYSRYLVQLDAVKHTIFTIRKKSDFSTGADDQLINLYLENRDLWIEAFPKIKVKIRENDLGKLALIDKNATIYLDTKYMKTHSVTTKEAFINIVHEIGHVFTNFDHHKLDEIGHLLATQFFENRNIINSSTPQKSISEDEYLKAVSNLFLDELGEIIVSKKNKYFLTTQWMDVEGEDGLSDTVKLDIVRTRMSEIKDRFLKQNPNLTLPRESIVNIETDVVCLESNIEYVYYSGHKTISQSFSKAIDIYKDFFPTYSKYINGHKEITLDYFYRVPKNKCSHSKIVARATLKMTFDPQRILEIIEASNIIAKNFHRKLKEIRDSGFFTEGNYVNISESHESSVHKILYNLNVILPQIRTMMINYGHRAEIRELANSVHDRIEQHVKTLKSSLSHIKRPIKSKDRSRTSHTDLSNDRKLSMLEGALIEVQAVKQVNSKLMQIISSSKSLRDISIELFDEFSYDTEVFLISVAGIYPELQYSINQSLTSLNVSRDLRREILSRINRNVLIFRGLLERAAPDKIIEAITSQNLVW